MIPSVSTDDTLLCSVLYQVLYVQFLTHIPIPITRLVLVPLRKLSGKVFFSDGMFFFFKGVNQEQAQGGREKLAFALFNFSLVFNLFEKK